jgi:hypothetical protein
MRTRMPQDNPFAGRRRQDPVKLGFGYGIALR